MKKMSGLVVWLPLFVAQGLSAGLYLDAAQKACRRRKYTEAYRFLQRTRSGDHFRRHCLGARVQLGLGAPVAALSFVSRALALDPGSSRALSLAVRILLKLRRPGEALPLVRSLLFMEPANQYAHGLAARVYLALRRFREALFHCRRSLQGRTDGWDCYLMGRILEKTGGWQAALLWYGRAQRLGVAPRRGWVAVRSRCIWKAGLASKRAGLFRGAAVWFRLLVRHYQKTPYGRAAREQLAALKRLRLWEKNKKTGKGE